MKKLIFICVSVICACVANATMGAVIGATLNAPLTGMIVGIALPLVLGGFIPAGVLPAGILTEIWTGELFNKLKELLTDAWLKDVRDASAYVGNDVIHAVDVGADPDVLVNNTTYPLNPVKRNDGDIAIQLDKFETVPTSISDDELYALSYDKMASVVSGHKLVIGQKILQKALHAIAPNQAATNVPVIVTTGDLSNGKRMLLKADVIALKRAFDKAEIPAFGRRLVLSTEHVNDLLAQDQKFADQYYNYQTGKIANLYGFEIFEAMAYPVYNAGVKKAFAAAAADTDVPASVAFNLQNIYRAMGTLSMYASDAKTDPLNKRSLVSFTQRALVMPVRAVGTGTIISATV